MPSLYLTQPGSRLEIERGRLLAVRDDVVLVGAPAARVDQVVIIGGSHVTTPALAYLLDHDIDLLFLTAGGAFRGRLDTGHPASVTTRRAQYRRADDPAFCLALSRAIVRGKIRNCRTRGMELDRDNDPANLAMIARLRQAMDDTATAASIPALMGIEGRAARAYFAVLRRHLREPWVFPARARRPPPDPVNALLSIAYTLLHEQCRAALHASGLDPACGYLHQPRAGRSSLALDLMEEFRPVIADPVVWTLLNKRILTPEHFIVLSNDQGARVTPEGWREIATQYTQRLETGIRVPGRATRTTYRKLLEVQARQMKRVILGDLDAYTPFASR